MAFMYLPDVLTLASAMSFLILCFLFNKLTHRGLLINWPLLGMLPSLLVHIHRIWDWSVDVLEASNLTFLFEGPWLGGIDTLITVDPANIHYILSSNFSNYTKGFEQKENFDVFGDGIINAESELWKHLRRSARSMIYHERFQRFSLATNVRKLEEGLVPILDHAAKENVVVDLQDLFQRFTSDTMFILVTGHDPRSLSMEIPELEFSKALEVAEEAVFYRNIKPRILWKLQNWVGLGIEKKFGRVLGICDSLCEEYISAKRQEIRLGMHSEAEAEDLLTSYINLDTSKYNLSNPSDRNFIRDNILSFLAAGTDTTSLALTWFFWLLSKNPEVVTRIRHEINTNLPRTRPRDRSFYDLASLKKLVYLHGALFEALRLYPPIPFLKRSPTEPDVLPSGHKVEAGSKILVSIYALGRMKSVWGEDALDFKPERWISGSGGSKHEPSSMFLPFNAGPRICLGRQMALAQMKMVAVEMVQSYDIEVVQGQQVEPVPSVILHMKHGLRVLITKRSSSA